MKHALYYGAAVMVCASFVGCGGGAAGKGADGLAVKGSVKFNGEPVGPAKSEADDDKPAGRGTITFRAKGKSSVHQTPIVNGEYSFSSNQGMEAGSFRVEVNWTKPTGKKVRDRESGEVSDGFSDVIPAKYNKESTLSADVDSKKTRVDFDLKD